MSRRFALAAAIAAAALAAPAAQAAPPATSIIGARADGGHAVRVLVRTPGTLTAADIEAELGRTPAFVEGVGRYGPERPVDLVIAIDTSGSMAGAPIQAALAAARRLTENVGPSGKVGLVTFSSGARVVRPLTANVARVRAALAGVGTQSGTALYDGVALAAHTVAAAADPQARHVVVVLSDGADTASRTTLPQLLRTLRASGIEVDAVGLESSGSFVAAPLQQVTSATGGEFTATRTLAGLQPIMLKLSQDRLSTTYAVDVQLPHTSARTLTLRIRGGAPASVALPAGTSGTGQAFFTAHGAVLVVVLGCLAAGMLAFLLVSFLTDRPPTLASRLEQYTAEVDAGPKRRHSLIMLDLYDLLERHLGERWAWKRLSGLVQQAGVAWPTGQVVVVTGVSVVAFTLAVWAGLGILPGIAALLLGLGAPVAMLRIRASRRHHKFEAQLPELLSVWASALRAGRSFAQALDSLVDEADDPARAEFRRAQHQVRLGVPIEQALDDMSRRLRSESFELVVLTTDVQRRVGGNVAEIFDQVADTVRRRQQFSARVRALTSMGRLSAQVLLGMPFAIAALLTLINHGYMAPLFTTHVGHVLIAIGLTMMSIGAVVLRRMVKPRAIA